MLVIPLLTEGGRRDHVDRVLLVDVPEALQVERLMWRDGVTREQAQASLDAQATRAQRLALADDVLRNTGRVDDLRDEVAALHRDTCSWRQSQEARSPHPALSRKRERENGCRRPPVVRVCTARAE